MTEVVLSASYLSDLREGLLKKDALDKCGILELRALDVVNALMRIEDKDMNDDIYGQSGPRDYQLDRLREENRRLRFMFWHAVRAAGGEVVVDPGALDNANPETMALSQTEGPDGAIRIEANGGSWPMPKAVVPPKGRPHDRPPKKIPL